MGDRVLHGNGDCPQRLQHGSPEVRTSTAHKYTGSLKSPKGISATGCTPRDHHAVEGNAEVSSATYGEFYAQGVPPRQEFIAKQEPAFSKPSKPPSVPPVSFSGKSGSHNPHPSIDPQIMSRMTTPRKASSFSGMAL